MENPEKCIEICRRAAFGDDLGIPQEVLDNLFYTAQYFEMKQSYSNMTLPVNGLNLSSSVSNITIPRVLLNKFTDNPNDNTQKKTNNIESTKDINTSSSSLVSKDLKEFVELNESTTLNSNLQKKTKKKKKKNSSNINLPEDNTKNREKRDDSLSPSSKRNIIDDKIFKANYYEDTKNLNNKVGKKI